MTPKCGTCHPKEKSSREHQNSEHFSHVCVSPESFNHGRERRLLGGQGIQLVFCKGFLCRRTVDGKARIPRTKGNLVTSTVWPDVQVLVERRTAGRLQPCVTKRWLSCWRVQKQGAPIVIYTRVARCQSFDYFALACLTAVTPGTHLTHLTELVCQVSWCANWDLI